jgi:hypothetical protein
VGYNAVFTPLRTTKRLAMAARLPYDLSCARLRELGLLAHNDQAPMPSRCLSTTTTSRLDSIYSEHASTMLSTWPTCPCLEHSLGARRSIEFYSGTLTSMSQICAGMISWELISQMLI